MTNYKNDITFSDSDLVILLLQENFNLKQQIQEQEYALDLNKREIDNLARDLENAKHVQDRSMDQQRIIDKADLVLLRAKLSGGEALSYEDLEVVRP